MTEDSTSVSWEEVARLLDAGVEDRAISLARQLAVAGRVAEPAAMSVLPRLVDVLRRAGIEYKPAPLAGSEPMLPAAWPEADDT